MTNSDDNSAVLNRLDDVLGNETEEISGELDGLMRMVASMTRDVEKLSSGINGELRGSLDQALADGVRLSDVLKGIGQSVADTTYRIATKPVVDAASDAIAQGVNGVASAVIPFAKGGVISGPVSFPLQGGTGLMGEAGPEAIMPLSRGPDGRLGVASAGGSRPVNVTFNITTPDVAGFRRSQSQIAAQMGRLLLHGGRNN